MVSQPPSPPTAGPFRRFGKDVYLAEVKDSQYYYGFIWRYPGNRIVAEPAIDDDNEVDSVEQGVRLLHQLGLVLNANGDLALAIASLQALQSSQDSERPPEM